MQRSVAILVAMVVILGHPESTFAQLRDGQPEWYLRGADDCRLFVQEYGTGFDTIVVLHGGWGFEHSYLLSAFHGLEDEYHIVFYDQRGSIRSPCPDSLVSVDRHVNDLERLRSQLGVERLNLVGHSMGTTLAMLYLDRHPDRVQGLVLMAASAPSTKFIDDNAELVERHEKAREAFFSRPEIEAERRRQGLDRDDAELTDKERTNAWRIRFAGFNLYHVERWRQFRSGQVFFSPSAGEAAVASMPREYDFMPALARHPCPIQVISGDHDFGPVLVEFQRAWTAQLENVELHVIEMAGHNAWIDQPDEFRAVLRRSSERSVSCN